MRAIAVVAALAALAPSLASAQPMMDPRAASGKPRAEPNDPAGKLVVRVIQGAISVDNFGNPQNAFPPDQVVHLVAVHADGRATLDSKAVDNNGRAIWTDLVTDGTTAYFATAVMPRGELQDRLRTQHISMPPKVGIRVLLAGEDPASGKPAVDDWADPRIPAIGPGEIIVEVRGSPDLWRNAKEVKLTELTTGQTFKTAPRVLADASAALYSDLPIDGKVYMASFVAGGRVYRSDPIVLTNAAGAFASLFAYPSLLMQFHGGAEVTDTGLEIDIQFALANGTGSPLNPGPDGIAIPLPAGFERAQVLEGKETVGINDTGFVWRGVFPPGQRSFVGRFRIPVDGDGKAQLTMPAPYGALQSQISLRSPHPDPGEWVDDCVARAPASGQSVQETERACMHLLGSRYVSTTSTRDELRFSTLERDVASFLVIPNITVGAGQSLSIQFEGLPTPPWWWQPVKLLAGIVVILAVLAAGAGLVVLRSNASPADDGGVGVLVIERDKLYERLVRLERSRAAGRVPDKRYKAQRTDLKSKLATVYEQLRLRNEA